MSESAADGLLVPNDFSFVIVEQMTCENRWDLFSKNAGAPFLRDVNVKFLKFFLLFSRLLLLFYQASCLKKSLCLFAV